MFAHKCTYALFCQKCWVMFITITTAGGVNKKVIKYIHIYNIYSMMLWLLKGVIVETNMATLYIRMHVGIPD